jgi:methanogenic corrinoid protein MtbC1
MIAIAQPQDRHSPHSPGNPAPPDAFMALLSAALADDWSLASDVCSGLVHRGVGIRFAYLDVIAPSLRLIGERARAGVITPERADGAIAVVLAQLDRLGASASVPPPRFGHVVLAAVGERHHDAGLRMVADFLRWDGWSVTVVNPPASQALVLEAAIGSRAQLVGLSVTCRESSQATAATIGDLRRHDPDIQVVVGGAAILAEPGLASAMGAQSMAVDARHACQVLRRAIPSRPDR